MLKHIQGRERRLKQWLLILLLVLGGSLASSGQALAGSDNGSAGLMPAFYDGRLFNINFKEQPATGESSLLHHNGSINTIYMCDQCESMGFMFVSVLDSIQGDGFNPLWQEVQVVFLPGFSRLKAGSSMVRGGKGNRTRPEPPAAEVTPKPGPELAKQAAENSGS